MGYIAKLVHGSRELDISGGRFALASSFVPPATPHVALMASGTSANRRRGSTKVNERAADIQIPLPIYIDGASDAEVRAGRNILASFINAAGQHKYNPLELHYRGDDSVSYEPVWGQGGANLRFEITHADSPSSWRYVGVADMRTKRELVRIGCTMRPYASGGEQSLASATGGVFEDKIGKVDLLSRGLIVPRATTNKMTNPIFGHGTYDNNWTAGGDLLTAANYDPEFILFGNTSARLTSETGTAANQRFYQSINAGNTNTHQISFYAKRHNGSAITNELKVLYGASSNVADRITSVGNGWYRVVKEVTGIASAQNTGVELQNDDEIYFVDGFQIEEKSFITPLCHGDMLGCSWAGTAHASTSSRTQAVAKIDVSSIFSQGEGTIRVALKAHVTDNEFDTDAYLFAINATNDMRALYNQVDRDWEFHDGTNQAQSTDAADWAAEEIVILHFTYGPAGLIIYVNGSSVGSTASHTPITSVTDLHIGDSVAGGAGIDATFMDLALYDREMTAAEVSDDYDNLSQVTSDDFRYFSIPWLWTKDGDDIVDGCNDSSRDNYCVIGGIPGNAPAETRLFMTLSQQSDIVNTLWMSLTAAEEWLDPGTYLYAEHQGTVDANASGGEYESNSISTTATSLDITTAMLWRGRMLEGKEAMLIARLKESTSGDTLQLAINALAGSTSLSSDYKNYTSLTTYQLLRSPAITMPQLSGPPQSYYADIWFQGLLKRPSGTQNTHVDYTQVVTRPLAMGDIQTGTTSANVMYIDGKFRLGNGFDYQKIYSPYPTFGDRIELEPEMANILFAFMGNDATDPAITWTLTHNEARIIPRWRVS